jgi:hypothetical protein
VRESTVRRGNLVLGGAVIAAGTLFLAATLVGGDVWPVVWPFFVIVPGVLFFVIMVTAGREAGALAIPGSMITITGLVLLYQSAFHHFATWAYAWTLVAPFGVGVGLYVWGRWSGRHDIRRAGLVVAKVGLGMFIAFGLLFEVVFNHSGGGAARVFWPVLLILFGVYLLVQPERHRSVPETSPASPPAFPPAGSPAGPPDASPPPASAPAASPSAPPPVPPAA